MHPSLALYIHWPFCRSKCPYCDFNSHVREQIPEVQWRTALLHELQRTRKLTGPRQLTSIFFGGGTPSLMQPETVAMVIEIAHQLYAAAPNIEITLEANPNSVEIHHFEGFRNAGINRVSIGIQSLQDASLKFLGRTHGRNEAIRAIETAQHVFEHVSFDLIYARPHQSLVEWQAELTEALNFGTTHLSVYQLTIEAGTAFATTYARGDFVLPDDDQAGALYELTQEMLEQAGLPAYEISNHARPGAESQHNLSYWRYQDYAGIGPGAHGRLTLENQKMATQQIRAPELWIQSIEKEGHGNSEVVPIPPETQAMEALMMGLRLREGVDTHQLACSLENVVNVQALQWLQSQNFLTLEQGQLKATAAGRQRLNAVLARLF